MLFGVHSQPYSDALAVKLHRRLTDGFSLWADESKQREVQREENFTHLCCEHGCRCRSAETAPQSGSSGPWLQSGFQAAEGEWASTEAWPGQQSFPGHLLDHSGPSSPSAPQLKRRSGLGIVQKTGLLLWVPPPVVGVGCLTGAGLPPSPPDHHSVRPKPENHENTSYGKGRTHQQIQGKKGLKSRATMCMTIKPLWCLCVSNHETKTCCFQSNNPSVPGSKLWVVGKAEGSATVNAFLMLPLDGARVRNLKIQYSDFKKERH